MIRFGDPDYQTGDPTPLHPQVKYFIMYYTFYYIEYYIKYYMIRLGYPEKSNKGTYTFRSTGQVLYNVLYFLLYKVLYKVLYNVLYFLLYRVLYKVLYGSFCGPSKIKQGNLHL
jgi:hypothetical protein